MRTLSLVVTAVVVLTGCSSTLKVGAANPKPNINLKKSNQTLALKLGPAVQDAFQVPKTDGPGPVDVTAWTSTITGGFAAAFESAFTMAHDGDLVLEVQEAGLGMTGNGTAQVRYKAQLLDKSGKQLALTSGTADSKAPCSTGDCSATAASAVETMFEQIAEKLFANAG